MPLVEVQFPGGKQVDARIAGRAIPTDQESHNGGQGQAPEPFQLFLASIATCAGIYAKSFCDERDLPAPHGLDMDLSRGDDGLIDRLDLTLRVDPEFPARYERAITRAMSLCAVKKHLRQEIKTVFTISRNGDTPA